MKFFPFIANRAIAVSFPEAPKKNRALKDFSLRPRQNSDIIKISWCPSPMRMTFYSTKNSWSRGDQSYAGIFLTGLQQDIARKQTQIYTEKGFYVKKV